MPNQSIATTRWAPGQRFIHWALVLVFGLGWWSGSTDLDWHVWVGYTALVLLGLRFVIGFSRHPHARWGFFWSQLWSQFRQFGRENKSDSAHQPPVMGAMGALSAIVLLMLMAATAITGWMLTLEEFVGEDSAENRHSLAFDLLIFWTSLHVFVHLVRWLRHRAAMMDFWPR